MHAWLDSEGHNHDGLGRAFARLDAVEQPGAVAGWAVAGRPGWSNLSLRISACAEDLEVAREGHTCLFSSLANQ